MSFSLSDLKAIYFCTGARNHDLLKIFSEEKLRFEIDERIASFKALGLAKGLKAPVAICTTSGTAVSECLSAMLEAKYSGVPLVLITGDRPKKQHGTGAPQTIDHEALTRDIRGSYLEVSLGEFKDLGLDQVSYPLHINVLVDDTVAHKGMALKTKDLNHAREFFFLHQSPLFLFSHEAQSMRPFVERFAKLGIPFYAESLSGARDLSPLRTERDLVSAFRSGKFDSVVRVGHTPLSKVWRLLENRFTPVLSFDDRGLSGLSYGTIFPLSSGELLESREFWEFLQKPFTYEKLPDGSLELETLIKKYPISEISTFRKITEVLPQNAMVYLGNSLVIRYFELVQQKPFQVFANRGVNGIDGQLASAIGLATSTKEKVYCLLGDLTTWYDLSSLADLPKNLHLIIMNNGGGRIFDTLNLDKRIVLEHNRNFAAISRAFNLSYSDSWSDWGKVQVLELAPELNSSEAFRKEWAP